MWRLSSSMRRLCGFYVAYKFVYVAYKFVYVRLSSSKLVYVAAIGRLWGAHGRAGVAAGVGSSGGFPSSFFRKPLSVLQKSGRRQAKITVSGPGPGHLPLLRPQFFASEHPGREKMDPQIQRHPEVGQPPGAFIITAAACRAPGSTGPPPCAGSRRHHPAPCSGGCCRPRPRWCRPSCRRARR